MHSLAEGAALAEAFVSTPFSGDPRHQRRIDMLTDYERTGTPPPLPASRA
jgi:ribose 5-phosphate isomerase B